MQKTESSNSYSVRNPLIAHLKDIREQSEYSSTYAGIAAKCTYFMVAVLAGAAIAMIIQYLFPVNFVGNFKIQSYSTTGAVILVIASIIFIVTPFVAILIRNTIPITGALYCASTGYVYSLLACALPEYRGAVMLAVIITVAIVAVMGWVYANGARFTSRMAKFITVFFLTTILTSIITFVLCLIPATREMMRFVWQNTMISVVISVIYVIIAALMLLNDFQAIQEAVECQLPKEYEWICAFGLAFSVIWLFLKVFTLIVKLKRISDSK